MAQLCEQCSVFKISTEKFRNSPFGERRMHQLGSFKDVASRTKCALCTLIAEAYGEGPTPASRLQSSSRIQGMWSQITEGLPDACLRFWLIENDENDKIELSVRPIEDRNSSGIGYGRMINVNEHFLDFNLIGNWIRWCENTHICQSVPLEATRAHGLPPRFMVIDVIDNCLVYPGKNCPFVCLSYVWGSSVNFKTTSHNVQELSSVGAFQTVCHQLSPTIRDAITLTRKLGERYIWIDSLCIQQDDVESAAANIEAMDSIYRHALLVIFAADDRAPEEGLAGVSGTKRKARQFTAEIAPDLQVLARFNHSSYMQRSNYRTRGWTYQEEQLSTRCLIFTNNQVYFTCPTFVYAEDIEAKENQLPDLTLTGSRDETRFFNEATTPEAAYFKSVATFTSRNLSYPSDILNAFRGVEAFHGQLLSSEAVQGLPSCIFDIALLWQPMAQLTRRPEFPSWSWAGWNGSVRWIGDTWEGHPHSSAQGLAKLTSWLRKRTWIVWCYMDEQKRTRLVWDPKQHRLVGTAFWPTSGWQKGQTVGYDPENWTPMNSYGRSTSDQELFSQYQTQAAPEFERLEEEIASSKEIIKPLFFKTLTVRFGIQSSSSYLRYGSMDPVWEPNGRVIFHLLNRVGSISGYVMLDESWKEGGMAASEEPQEFILLSEANYYCDWGRPHENHPYKKFWGMEEYEEFHVMMVQWRTLDNGLRVAERAGIGRLLNEAVADTFGEKPVWKDIILV